MAGGFFPVIGVTDMNIMGGMVMTGVPNVLIGPRHMPIATMTISLVTPHFFGGIPPKPIHPPNPIMVNCSPTVRAGMTQMPVAHIGSIDMCLHPMIGPGVPNLLVGAV